ncbi:MULTISPECIES: hypothetical protein [unclassified Serratia (in: enterobacteria)]|nr:MULTISPECIES: hypothetical protein [unclassified Serratia (in: enterobacteria)]
MLKRDEACAEAAQTETTVELSCSTGKQPMGWVISITPAGGGWIVEKQ